MTFPTVRTGLAFWSRKVLRRFGPLFLVPALVFNASLAVDPFYLRILLLHFLAYIIGGFVLWLLGEEQSSLLSHIKKSPQLIKSKLLPHRQGQQTSLDNDAFQNLHDIEEAEEEIFR